MLHVSPTGDNADTSVELSSTGLADRDLAYEEWCDDVARNAAAADDAEAAMIAAQDERDVAAELAASPFGEISEARHAEIMAAYPTGTGWIPCILHHAAADKPFVAQLRRGTESGPDIAHVGAYSTPENALTACVLFAINLELATKHDDADAKVIVSGKVVYARPAVAHVA